MSWPANDEERMVLPSLPAIASVVAAMLKALVRPVGPAIEAVSNRTRIRPRIDIRRRTDHRSRVDVPVWVDGARVNRASDGYANGHARAGFFRARERQSQGQSE